MRPTLRRVRRLAGPRHAVAVVPRIASRQAPATLLVLLAALIPAGAAAAAIDPATYEHIDIRSDYAMPNGSAGGVVWCPAGKKAVASGVTSTGLHDEWLAGTTTDDGDGAFVRAWGRGGDWLESSVRCVPAAQVQAATLASLTIRVHTIAPFQQGRASCPPGTVAFGGGGRYTRPDGTPTEPGAVVASMPDPDLTHWTFAAGGSVSVYPDSELRVRAHCLPRSQFGQIVTATASDTAPDRQPQPANYPVLSAGARCPLGFYAYAGGAWLQPSGSSAPAWVGYLSVS